MLDRVFFIAILHCGLRNCFFPLIYFPYSIWTFISLPYMIKGVTHAHFKTNLHHSEPSDVPYSPNQFLALDFFAAS